jgi:hypothetical protein
MAPETFPEEYGFEGGPYLRFPASRDVYGDGSIVVVLAFGHTPGSVIIFVTLPNGTHYAFVGDLVWQLEGITQREERPWITRRRADTDAEEHHPEGNFYLHRYDGGREIWKRVGLNAQDAVEAAEFDAAYLEAKSKGIPVKPIDTPNLTISAAAHGWLQEVKLSTRPETYELYAHTVRLS